MPVLDDVSWEDLSVTTRHKRVPRWQFHFVSRPRSFPFLPSAGNRGRRHRDDGSHERARPLSSTYRDCYRPLAGAGGRSSRAIYVLKVDPHAAGARAKPRALLTGAASRSAVHAVAGRPGVSSDEPVRFVPSPALKPVAARRGATRGEFSPALLPTPDEPRAGLGAEAGALAEHWIPPGPILSLVEPFEHCLFSAGSTRPRRKLYQDHSEGAGVVPADILGTEFRCAIAGQTR